MRAPSFGSCAALALAIAWASPARAQLECPAVVLLYDEDELLKERQNDSNGDCRTDEWVFYAGGLPLRAEQDMDYDGRNDAWVPDAPLIPRKRMRVSAYSRSSRSCTRSCNHSVARLPTVVAWAGW